MIKKKYNFRVKKIIKSIVKKWFGIEQCTLYYSMNCSCTTFFPLFGIGLERGVHYILGKTNAKMEYIWDALIVLKMAYLRSSYKKKLRSVYQNGIEGPDRHYPPLPYLVIYIYKGHSLSPN